MPDALFADPAFTTSAEAATLRLVQVSLPSIGLPDGGRFDQILAAAAAVGLAPCPLESGPENVYPPHFTDFVFVGPGRC